MLYYKFFFIPLILVSFFTYSQKIKEKEPFAHTFSIIGIDPENGDMGIAVQSHWFSVGNSVSWGEAGVGIIATQALVNFDYGPKGLKLLKEGKKAKEVLSILLAEDPEREMRQLAILDKYGNVAASTGKVCVDYSGNISGKGYSIQGNFLDNDKVLKNMSEIFEKKNGDLATRLLSSLEEGINSGGDIRGKQSASLLIVRAKPTGKLWIDRKVDLRVDDNENPVAELKRLYNVHKAYDFFNKGSNALMLKDLKSADSYFKSAQKLYPNNVEMTFWYAVELANIGELKASLKIFADIFRKNNSWKTSVLPRVKKSGLLNISDEDYKQILKL